MAQPSYYTQLRHPKWQQKRLRIMERAGFACEECGAQDITLNVHHTYYEKGKAPWEYPDTSLQCLCEFCHEEATEQLAEISRRIGGLMSGGRMRLLGYLTALLNHSKENLPADQAEGTRQFLEGMSEWLRVSTDEMHDGISAADMQTLVRYAVSVGHYQQ